MIEDPEQDLGNAPDVGAEEAGAEEAPLRLVLAAAARDEEIQARMVRYLKRLGRRVQAGEIGAIAVVAFEADRSGQDSAEIAVLNANVAQVALASVRLAAIAAGPKEHP